MTIEEFQVLTQRQTSVPRRRLGCPRWRLFPFLRLLLGCISKSAQDGIANE